MLHTSKLRSGSRNGFTRALKHLAAVFALLTLLPAAASAYTVVLRNGRVREIPANFTVTRAGITYEYASGLYVTIQMTSIDIAATERANSEPQGSLLGRAGARPSAPAAAASVSSSASSPPPVARRTLTDRELDAARRRREANEAAYERRRLELGLPSSEEMRRQREEETRRLSQFAAEAEMKQAQAESYWRARAEALRTEIAVNDAEINYLRSQLRGMSGFFPNISFTTITPFALVSPVTGRFPVRNGFAGGAARGPVPNTSGAYNVGARRPPFGRQGISVWPFPFYVPYGNNYSYEQSALITRLHELESERAGLQARWTLLEEDARRAGAPPGWLRP